MKKPNKLLVLAFIISCWLSLDICQAQVDDVSGDKFSVVVAGNTLKIPYYASQDIYTTNLNISKLIIVIHGNNRDAGPYLSNMQIAANNSSVTTDDVLLIAPQFLTEDDIDFYNLDNEHLYWTSGGWKSGSNSRDESSNPRPARIPSYAVLDRLMLHLAQQFPNLEFIVLAGHSAGAQVTQRMAALSPIPDQLCTTYGIEMRTIVANPSSYVYLNGERSNPNNPTQFITPNNTPCSDYNEWKYGLEDLFTYGEAVGADSIRNMYERREVIYLLGAEDNDPNSSSLDDSCEADLQGSHRLERGQIYFNYIQHYYGSSITDKHELIVVPNASHNNLEMWNSASGRFQLFERPFNSNCEGLVSSEEINSLRTVNIYPNPASTQLNISLLDPAIQYGELMIFNLKGQSILQQVIGPEFRLDLTAYDPAVYYLRIRFSDRLITQKLVVN